MVFATLFPLGILQLYQSVSVGYFDARSLNYITTRTNAVLILGGAVAVLYLTWLGVRRSKPQPSAEEAPENLFTEVIEVKGIAEAKKIAEVTGSHA